MNALSSARELLERCQAIIFDFDGVLAESLDVKGLAFRDLYLEHGDDIANAVLLDHKAHGGVTRYEKFKKWHQQFLGRNITCDEAEALAQRFSSIVERQVIACDPVPGSLELLRWLRSRDIPLAVASATPQKELEHILEARGLRSYFTQICGHPTGKTEAILAFCKNHCIAPDFALMVGDTIKDWAAAQAAGCQFLGRDTGVGDLPAGVTCIRNFLDLTGQ